jgi:uncharacterized protein (TIGR02300 family)
MSKKVTKKAPAPKQTTKPAPKAKATTATKVVKTKAHAKAKKAISSPSPKKSSKIENNGLGKKFTCYSCGTKFYDFGKEDKICPKCGADQNIKPVTKTKLAKSFKLSEFDVVDDLNVGRGIADEEDILLDPDADMEAEPSTELEGEENEA